MATSLGLPNTVPGDVGKSATHNTQTTRIDEAVTDQLALDFTSGNITLTDAQIRRNFSFECSNVSVARTLDLDSPTGGIKRFILVRSVVANTANVTVNRGSTNIDVLPDTDVLFYMDGTANGLAIMTSSGASVALIGLTDGPSSYTSQAKKLVQVNDTPDGFEFTGPCGGFFQGLIAETLGHHNSGVGQADDNIRIEALGGFFEDGTPFGKTGLLNIDLGAANGAGALDTGTLTANKWYEMHIIQRDDTGAFSAIATLAIDTTRDQFQATDNADIILRKADNTTDMLAQGFQPTRTEPLLAVDLWLESVSAEPAADSSIWVTIEGDSAGDPDGTPLATSEYLMANHINDVTKRIRFVFPDPPSLTASTQYHIVLHGDYAVSDTASINVAGNTASSYANGVTKKHNGSVWSAATVILDMKFETIGQNGGNNPTMPANYTQNVKIGYFRTDTSSDIEPFKQIEKRCEYYGDFAIASHSLATVDLTDCKACLPPTDCVFEFAYEASSTTPEHYFGGVPHGMDGGVSANVRIPFHQIKRCDPVTAVFQTRANNMIMLATKLQGVYQRLSTATGNGSIAPLAYTWRD